MQTLRNKLIALAAVGVLAVIGSMMNSHPATAQPKTTPAGAAPVNIVNTAADPVPVALNGTATVALNGTANVNVTNATPIAVRDANDPLKTPFSKSFPFLGGDFDDSAGPATTFQVPANQRLEIEFVSCQGVISSTSQPPTGLTFDFRVGFFDSTTSGVFELVARDAFQRPGSMEPTWATFSKVLLHVPAGGSLFLQAARSATGSLWGAGCTVQGYTITVP